MLLIPDDFKGKSTLPNLGDVTPLSNKLGSDDFLLSISEDEIEEEIISILGWELFKIIKSFISPELNVRFKDTVPNNIKELVEGKDNYRGMIYPLKSLAYFYYLKETNSDLSGTGVKAVKSKTGDRYPAREKAVSSYNKFAKYMYGADDETSIKSHLGMFSVDYSVTNFNSVYKFLLENKDNYLDLILGRRKNELLNNLEIPS